MALTVGGSLEHACALALCYSWSTQCSLQCTTRVCLVFVLVAAFSHLVVETVVGWHSGRKQAELERRRTLRNFSWNFHLEVVFFVRLSFGASLSPRANDDS